MGWIIGIGIVVLAIGGFFLVKAANQEATNRQTVSGGQNGRIFLSANADKRRRMVSEFNDKFELNLNNEQIQQIVDASYSSKEWEREVGEMHPNYHHVSEWYRSADTNWLRAYLRACPMMNITMDFQMQRSIVEDTFKRILTELPPGDFPTVKSAVDETNRRFYTLFDETTYMIMFRYMQEKGMQLKTPNGLYYRPESEVQELAKKYDDQVADEARARQTRSVHTSGPAGMDPVAASRQMGIDNLQAVAEEQKGSMSNEEMERLIRAYDKMEDQANSGGAQENSRQGGY